MRIVLSVPSVEEESESAGIVSLLCVGLVSCIVSRVISEWCVRVGGRGGCGGWCKIPVEADTHRFGDETTPRNTAGTGERRQHMACEREGSTSLVGKGTGKTEEEEVKKTHFRASV